MIRRRRRCSLSVYSQQLEILQYVENYQREHPSARVRFTCFCVCEVRLDFKWPSWKPHPLQSTADVRDWLLRHKEHEFSVDIQVEGLRPRERQHAPWGGVNPGAHPGTDGLTWKQRTVIRKLRALAGDNPGSPEARSAQHKADELLARYTARAAPGRRGP
jgi:hypothetical protein